jgi:hypothetical protein
LCGFDRASLSRRLHQSGWAIRECGVTAENKLGLNSRRKAHTPLLAGVLFMTYAQKPDWRHMLLSATILALGAGLVTGLTPLSQSMANLYGWVLLALGVLAVWEALATWYEFTKSDLVIHSGGTRQHIRYETIEAVRLAHGLLSWLACPNTVRLLVGSRSSASEVALRPRERDRFLEELSRAVPWLGVMEE